MKSLFAFFFLLASVESFAQGVYNARGAVKTQQKEFAAFVNSANAALTVGEGVCLDLTTDDGIGIDYCTASGVPVGLIVDTSCAVGARCLVQTKGVFEAAAFLPGRGNGVAGDPFFVHTDGSIYGDTTPADNIQHLGLFLDAITATGTVQVYIK